LSTVLTHYQSQFNDCKRLGKNVLLFTDVPKTKHEAFNLVDEIVKLLHAISPLHAFNHRKLRLDYIL